MPPSITSHPVAHKTDSGKRATALARAFQHEIDHLNGILFIDRMNAVAKVSIKRNLARLMEEWEEEE